METLYQHQKDLNGCGLACLANLLNQPYDKVKKDFESKFYPIKNGIKIFDIVRYLETKGFFYKSKFFNQNPKHQKTTGEEEEFTKIVGSIILIVKNDAYPVGHYLLRVKNGWVDPWYNFPSIDNVHAGIRTKLPNNAWYVLYPRK